MTSEPSTTSITVSVVVPVYSGERYIEKLIDAIAAVRYAWAADRRPLILSEVILVDDCARDGSPEIVDRLAAKHAWVTGLHLGRNSGQHAATAAGILYTSGDWVVTLDEDLQHPPSRIVDLLRTAVERSSDIVYANAQGRIHGAFRDLASRSYKRLICWLANSPHAVHFNSFRLIRGSVARAASSVCSYDTYFDVALSWFTGRVASVEMTLTDERFQQSKASGYNLLRLLSHARKLLFSNQLKVLRLGTGIGIATVAASALLAAWVLLAKLIDPGVFPIQGWTSLMLTTMFLGGLILLMLGIVLEYMSVLILRAHGRPLYFVIDRSSDAVLRQHFADIGP